MADGDGVSIKLNVKTLCAIKCLQFERERWHWHRHFVG